MDTVTPIIPGLEKYEIKIGGADAGQPEQDALPILRAVDGRVITRWTFTEEERRAIAEGADLYLTTMTFNQPFQAVKMDIGSPQPGASTERIKLNMRLDEQAELTTLIREYNRCAAATEEAKETLGRRQREIFAPPAAPKIVLVQ